MQTPPSSFQPSDDEIENPGLWHHLLQEIPLLSPSFWENRHDLEIQETGFILAQAFLGDQIPDEALQTIVRRAFPADLLLLDLAPADLVLELFDGPTGTYHDFGARLAAEFLGWRYRDSPGGFSVVAALPVAQQAAALSALTSQRCRALWIEPGHFTHHRDAPRDPHSSRWITVRYGGDFHECGRMVEELLEATGSANSARPLATIRADSFPWILGLAIALLHSSNQFPAGIKPTFVIPASCVALHTAMKLLERLGLPIEETISASIGNDETAAGLQHHLTEAEAATAVREMKALYNYDCDLEGAAAWRAAQIWRASHLGIATTTVIPLSHSDRGEMPEIHEKDLSDGERIPLEWLMKWAAQPV